MAYGALYIVAHCSIGKGRGSVGTSASRRVSSGITVTIVTARVLFAEDGLPAASHLPSAFHVPFRPKAKQS